MKIFLSILASAVLAVSAFAQRPAIYSPVATPVPGTAVTSAAGTAGQVLVNGGTAAQTGAVTLSLASGLTGINSLSSATGQPLTLGTGTSGTAVSIASATNIATFSAALSAPSYTSTVATGTAPLIVASTTLVANLHAATADSATSTTNATNIGITDDTTTNATMYPLWVTAATGNLPAKVSSTKMNFNPSTGALTGTTFNLGTTTPGIISGSAGAITLTGAGTNQNITLAPSGTGGVGIGGTPLAGPKLSILGSSVVTSPSADWNGANTPVFIAFAEGNSAGTLDSVIGSAGSSSVGKSITFRTSSGTLAVPTAFDNTGTAGAINSGIYDGSAFRNTASIDFAAQSAATASVAPQQIIFRTGQTTSRSNRLLLRANGQLQIGVTGETVTAWGASGIIMAGQAGTWTDSSTAISGTAALATFYSFAAPTLAAFNTTVTTTDAFTAYFVAPIQGTNQTITRKHTLGIVDATSAASSITGGLVISTTLGTTATSVGIGSGKINTGGDITSGANLIITKRSIPGVTSTATAAGTTTLTTTSTLLQIFTGSTTQNVQLPAANLDGAGFSTTFIINNQSSGAVTLLRAGSDTFPGAATTFTVAAGASYTMMSDSVSLWTAN